MRRVVWLLPVLALAGCGGDKSSATLTVVCGNGTQLVGAASIDVLGDPADGRPVMQFPDPANRGRTGVIAVQAHDHCKITSPVSN